MIHWDLLLTSPRYLSKRAARQAIRKRADILKGKALDLGSKKSPFVDYLPLIESFVSVDVELEVSPDVCADAERLPFNDSYFDSIICTELLEHVPEPERVLFECRRVLRPGGMLYLTVPMTWYLHYEPNDYYRFTKYGLVYLCEKVGFSVDTVERVGGFVFYLCVRFGEAVYRVGMKIVSPLTSVFGLPRVYPKRMISLLLVPYQLVALLLSKAFDRFSPRDAKGWVVVAEAPRGERYGR